MKYILLYLALSSISFCDESRKWTVSIIQRNTENSVIVKGSASQIKKIMNLACKEYGFGNCDFHFSKSFDKLTISSSYTCEIINNYYRVKLIKKSDENSPNEEHVPVVANTSEELAIEKILDVVGVVEMNPRTNQ